MHFEGGKKKRGARLPVTLVYRDEGPLQRLLLLLSAAGGFSPHLSLTVMKQAFNARRQPTRVESSLSQGAEVETVIFLIIIFVPALRPD